MTAESVLYSISKAEQMAKEITLMSGPVPKLAEVVFYLREARFKSEAYVFGLLHTASPYDRCDVEIAGRQLLKQMDDLIRKAEGASL
jgi:hypothetical protein